jgi:hypothetical protein
MPFSTKNIMNKPSEKGFKPGANMPYEGYNPKRGRHVGKRQPRQRGAHQRHPIEGTERGQRPKQSPTATAPPARAATKPTANADSSLLDMDFL